MSTMSDAPLAIEIRPWQAALYNCMRNPNDLKTISRKIERMGRDLQAMRAMGDTDAVHGAATALCLLLLEGASLTLSKPKERQTRTQLFEKWSTLWRNDPLLRVMFESTTAPAKT